MRPRLVRSNAGLCTRPRTPLTCFLAAERVYPIPPRHGRDDLEQDEKVWIRMRGGCGTLVRGQFEDFASRDELSQIDAAAHPPITWRFAVLPPRVRSCAALIRKPVEEQIALSVTGPYANVAIGKCCSHGCITTIDSTGALNYVPCDLARPGCKSWENNGQASGQPEYCWRGKRNGCLRITRRRAGLGGKRHHSIRGGAAAGRCVNE